MKKILAVLLAAALLMLSPSMQVLSAQPALQEKPGIKLFVNGNKLQLKSAVLSLSGVWLVPAKETLIALGIPDQSENMAWDGKKKKLAIRWKGKSIVFKTGSKSVVVNGKPSTMNAMCLSYSKNKKVYVPLKSAAGLLDYTVVSDNRVNSVYISDNQTFKENRQLLETIHASVGKLERLNIHSTVKLGVGSGEDRVILNADMTEELDLGRRLLHTVAEIPALGSSKVLETFYSNNEVYAKNPDGSWGRSTLSEEAFNKALLDTVSIPAFNRLDVLAACMKQSVDPVTGRKVLRGFAYPGDPVPPFAAGYGVEKAQIEEFVVEAVLDSSGVLVESLHMELGGSCTLQGVKVKAMDAVIDIIYSDPGETSVIVLPEW